MADLESDLPPVEPPPAPPAPPPVEHATPPAPPEPPAEPEPEGTVEVGGQRLAPVGAVIAERKARQQMETQLREQAQAIQQLQPYVQFIQANQHLFTPGQQPPVQPAAPTTPTEDPEAVELARTLDLYTPDGKPDAARALKLVTLVDRRAQAQARDAVRPVEEMSARERVGVMYQRALVTTAPDGRKADPQILQRLFSQTDPRISGTEEGAAGLVAMAIGLGALANQTPAPPAPPANPPLITETPGGRGGGRVAALSALDQSVIKIRGVKPEAYADLTRGFNPGVSNVLEE